jgi:phosphoserine phosphatase
MTKIILIRHGHVEGISPERFRGRADLSSTREATARRQRRRGGSARPGALRPFTALRCGDASRPEPQ